MRCIFRNVNSSQVQYSMCTCRLEQLNLEKCTNSIGKRERHSQEACKEMKTLQNRTGNFMNNWEMIVKTSGRHNLKYFHDAPLNNTNVQNTRTTWVHVSQIMSSCDGNPDTDTHGTLLACVKQVSTMVHIAFKFPPTKP